MRRKEGDICLSLLVFLFLLLVCYVFIQMVAVRVFPEYGVRKAEERYRRNPSAENEDLLWRARSRITKRK